VIEVLTSKRVVVLLLLAAGSIVLVSGSREWVAGSVDDAVLGANALQGKGADLAPGAMAAALVGLASAVAAATSGPAVRVVAACAALLAAVLGAAAVISVLVDPGGALGALAAAGTGRSGTLTAHGPVGGWAWVALAALLVMGSGGVGALVGGRRWRGLSSRYDAPVARRSSQADTTAAQSGRPESAAQSGRPESAAQSGRPESAAQSGRPESAWDQLSRGDDPTA